MHPLFSALNELYRTVWITLDVHNKDEGKVGRAIVDKAISIVQDIFATDTTTASVTDIKNDTLKFRIARGSWEPKPGVDVNILPVIAGWCPGGLMAKILEAGADLFASLPLTARQSARQSSRPSVVQRSAIFCMVKTDNIDGVKAIAEKSYNTREKQILSEAFASYEYMGLNLLCYAESAEMVRLLVSLGVTANPKNVELDNSPIAFPIVCAVRSRRIDVVDALIDCGADVNTCVNGTTLLSSMLENTRFGTRVELEKFVVVVRKLVKMGVKLNLANILIPAHFSACKEIHPFNEINQLAMILLSTVNQPRGSAFMDCVNYGTYDIFLSLCAVATGGGECTILSHVGFSSVARALIFTLCDSRGRLVNAEKYEKLKMLDLIAHSSGCYEAILYLWPRRSEPIVKLLFSQGSVKERSVTLFDMLLCRQTLADRLIEIKRSID